MTPAPLRQSQSPGYDVHITDTTTGETRLWRCDSPWEDGSDYLWGDGNYSCDCNRHLFFTDWADDEGWDCGDGRYTVRITDDDGKELYRDDTATA